MNKEYLIKLTQRLYRLTFLFPKKEPLRYKMREVGDDILADSISAGPRSGGELLERLDILDSFFEVAKTQNWVSFNELLQLQEEYIRLKGELPDSNDFQVEVEPKTSPLAVTADVEISPSAVNGRQKKILDILKEKDKAQVWEIKKIFPEVSKRTLRRDFEKLLKQGFIERIGESNNTFYILKGRTI